MRTIACIVLLLAAHSTRGQDEDFVRGRSLYAEQRWREAAEAFGSVVAARPSHGQAWFWLGLSRYRNGEDRAALEALFMAESLKANLSFARFAIARSYARVGLSEDAMLWLDRAAEAGFSNVEQFDQEEQFTTLRSDPRGIAIRERFLRNSTPAEADPRYRQLDFWIGEWEVYDPGGTKVGTNSITRELGGALLLERWTSMLGLSGMSMNYFDPGSGMFRQHWVAQSGYNTAYEGRMVNDSMVFEGVRADMNGTRSRNRMTLTPNPDGTVTQRIEVYDGTSDSWTPTFQGTYRQVMK